MSAELCAECGTPLDRDSGDCTSCVVDGLRKEIAVLTASLANRDSQLASMIASLAEARERLAMYEAACEHSNAIERAFEGGDGPDDASTRITCDLCGAYRWKYCDGALSDWRPAISRAAALAAKGAT